MKKFLIKKIILILFSISFMHGQQFITHSTNYVTFASFLDNGYIGHSFMGTPGLGFSYTSGPDALYTGGFMAGYSGVKMVGLVGSLKDMKNLTPFGNITSNSNFNQIAETKYSDSLAPVENRIGLVIEQTTLSNNPDHSVFILYKVKNESGVDISGLYTGIFADWDIGGNQYIYSNRGGYDVSRNLVYCYSNSVFADNRYYGFRALDSMGGAMIHDSSSISDLRSSVFSWMRSTAYAPITADGDMRMWISSGSYNIQNGASITTAFALVAGSNLNALQKNSDSAYSKWVNIQTAAENDIKLPENNNFEQNYPNPFNPSTSINFTLSEPAFVQIVVYNLLGEEIQTVVNEFKNSGSYKVIFDASYLASGIYFYKMQTPKFKQTKKMIIIR